MIEATYERGLKRMSDYMNDHDKKIGVFDASLVLAYIFDRDKEGCLDDLLDLRKPIKSKED